jgi:hypothetical protein
LTVLGPVNLADRNLVEEIRRLELADAVSFERQVSYRESLERMGQADILVMLDGPGRRMGVPGKLYEYLGARRPILALTDAGNDTDWVLQQSGVLHRLANPADQPAITQSLSELIAAVQSHRPVHAQPELLERFTRRHMARCVADLLDQCVAESVPNEVKMPRACPLQVHASC